MTTSVASAPPVAPATPPVTLRRRLLQAAVLGLPVGVFMVAGWAHRWIVDDGFIYLRVVKQIENGNGPVFNQGERVEVFTSVLWLALLTIGDVLTPIRLEWLAVTLGIALSGAAVALAMAGAARLVRQYEHRAFLVPFGVVVVMVLVPSWIFQTSGLETGLVLAWLGSCLFLLARWAASVERLPTITAFVIGLGWLVRPELAMFSAVFVIGIVAAQWRRSQVLDGVRIVLAAAALPFAYQVFRMGYYGSLVSNPAIAKDSSSTNWSRGWDYLFDYTDPYWLWVPALVVLAGGYIPLVVGLRSVRGRRSLLVVAMFALAAVLDGLYIVAVGGDWLHARLLLPASFAMLAPVALIPATRAAGAGVLLAPWAVAAIFWLRPAQLDPDYPITGQFILGNNNFVTVDERGWGENGPRRRWFRGDRSFYYTDSIVSGYERSDVDLRPGLALPSVASLAIGVSSYALGPDVHIIDMLGLADTLTAHMISTPSMTGFDRKPGHAKQLPPVWLAALATPDGSQTRPADWPQTGDPLIPATKGAEFQEQVAWARAALHCPEINGLLQSVRAPLGPRRYLSNIVHSFERTRLQIPPDPEEAYHKFCGSGTPEEVTDLRR